MKKNWMIALAATGFLFGANAALGNCKGPDSVDLTVGKYHLSLNEHVPICVEVPGTINIRIKNPAGSGHDVQAGDVTASQKEPLNPDVDISGDNSADEGWLEITINGTASVGEEFEFLIDVEDVGVLDPRIRVVPSSQVEALLWQSVEQHAYELEGIATAYGVSVEEVFDLLRKTQAE